MMSYTTIPVLVFPGPLAVAAPPVGLVAQQVLPERALLAAAHLLCTCTEDQSYCDQTSTGRIHLVTTIPPPLPPPPPNSSPQKV